MFFIFDVNFIDRKLRASLCSKMDNPGVGIVQFRTMSRLGIRDFLVITKCHLAALITNDLVVYLWSTLKELPMRICALVAVSGFLVAFSARGQIGQEWINYDQQYFKIAVARDGIYRVTESDLIAAGLPNSIDPANLQLYHRGIEQAIWVEGQEDGQLNAGDFIEFFGQKNDGTLDAELYATPASQPHRYYNLFSDTTYYFLTVGPTAGKRMPVIPWTGPSATPETFHWNEKLIILKDEYATGITYGDAVKSAFDTGEGWTGAQITQGQSRSYIIENIGDQVEPAGLPKIEILITGRGNMSHNVEVYAGPRLVTTLSFSGNTSTTYTDELSWSDVTADGKLTMTVTVPSSSLPDRVSVGYMRLLYPASWNMGSVPQKVFMTNASGSDPIYIEIQNAPAGTTLFDITNPQQVSVIESTGSGTLKATLPGAGHRAILAAQGVITPDVVPATFSVIDNNSHDFVIITHPLLRRPALGYTDPVSAYAEYRSLPAGGGFNPIVVNIQDLYDQFSYGETSPLAIFRFMKYLAAGQLPEYLFLIGKGLDVYYGYHRNPSVFTTYKDLIPSAGYPASDMLFSAGLSGVPDVPAVATGRLSASFPQDVAAYLNKVKAQEAAPFDNLRRKNVLHLSGGIFGSEPQVFRSYLEGFAAIAESHYLGAHVTPIAKQATELQVINVADEVNSGLGLITFFGHSGPTTTDFDIGHVTDPAMGYHNPGQYPVLLMNGCSIGSFFLNGIVFGENWILAPDRGAIGFIAHSGLGLASALRNYSTLFYETAMADTVFINKGLGDIQREIAGRYLAENGNQPIHVTQVHQMVLLGDPAVKLFGATKPDFEIGNGNISISSYDGDPVTVLSDSFRLNVVVRNFGQTRNKPIRISVERILPDNSRVSYDTLVASPLYSDTLALLIPAEANSAGNNTFHVVVDADHVIDELNEANNEAEAGFFIPLSGTRNLSPPEYAIVNSRNVDLIFQHTDPLAGDAEYVVELDTVNTFDSPLLQTYSVSGPVIGRQRVTLQDTDTTAYYWRTKLSDPTATDSVVWDESSFTYILEGPEGWAQTHFPQFTGNALESLVSDPEIRVMNFKETITDIAVRTFGSAAGEPADSVSVKINGAEYNISPDFPCRNNTINLIAFDRKTAHPYPGLYLTWEDLLFTYGGRTLICGREPFVINSYRADELSMGNDGDLLHYLDNIPFGDSVIVFNIGDAAYSQWPGDAVDKLGEIGISPAQISSLADGEPVIIFGRKGAAPGTAMLLKGIDTEQLSASGTVTGRTTSGAMTSPPIGPAAQWDQILPAFTGVEPSDSVSFDVIGVTASGTEDLIFPDMEGNVDITSINPATYPFLRLRFKPYDDVYVTAPQLKKWLVLFEPVPEGVAIYRGPSEPDTLFEGQTWDGDYAFVNVSNKDFADSLEVSFKMSTAGGFGSADSRMKIKGPAAGDTTLFAIPFKSVAHAGTNDLTAFVNPNVVPEQNYNNNIIALNNHLTIVADSEDPVLDVTFDGRHLVNNDFVSTSPRIRITVWDNNPYLLKQDTTGVVILLASPCGADNCPFERVYFSTERMSWQPETDTSEFVVNFNPVLEEGTYTLRVEGRDATGNPSGSEPYLITFNVVGINSVVVDPPFPNPFNYSATFNVVIAGDTVPDWISLQVVDLNGRTVYLHQITGDGYYVGTNAFEWDGRTTNGDAMPSGLYFYKITVGMPEGPSVTTGKIVLAR